ncbi:MAG: hypothetical protein ABIQ95_16325 [Bdellovibrionia bacterium]
MRCSIPSLFILWIFVARAVFHRTDLRAQLCSKLLIVTLFLGSFTALAELIPSLNGYTIALPERSKTLTPDLVPVLGPEGVALQYLGDPQSFFFKYLAKENSSSSTR